MDWIVVKTANPGGPHAGGFRFEIKNLPDYPGFPEEMPVKRGSVLGKARIKVRNHAQAEASVRGNVLITAETTGEGAAIPAAQTDDGERVMRRLTAMLAADLPREPVESGRIAAQHIESRRDTSDSVHEEEQMDSRRPPQARRR